METLRALNYDLINEVMAQIESEPDRWDQRAWAQFASSTVQTREVPLNDKYGYNETMTVTDCGTSHCFAGWAVQKSGLPIALMSKSSDYWPIYTVQDGNLVLIYIAAGELLGLTEDEADYLFSSENTLENLKETLYGFAERRGDDPDLVYNF